MNNVGVKVLLRDGAEDIYEDIPGGMGKSHFFVQGEEGSLSVYVASHTDGVVVGHPGFVALYAAGGWVRALGTMHTRPPADLNF